MPIQTDTSVAAPSTRLVKLTQVYGISTSKTRPVWINPAQVAWMIRNDVGALIQFVGEEHTLHVLESPDDIVWLIEQAQP
jgi:hypothetical protein